MRDDVLTREGGRYSNLILPRLTIEPSREMSLHVKSPVSAVDSATTNQSTHEYLIVKRGWKIMVWTWP